MRSLAARSILGLMAISMTACLAPEQEVTTLRSVEGAPSSSSPAPVSPPVSAPPVTPTIPSGGATFALVESDYDYGVVNTVGPWSEHVRVRSLSDESQVISFNPGYGDVSTFKVYPSSVTLPARGEVTFAVVFSTVAGASRDATFSVTAGNQSERIQFAWSTPVGAPAQNMPVVYPGTLQLTLSGDPMEASDFVQLAGDFSRTITLEIVEGAESFFIPVPTGGYARTRTFSASGFLAHRIFFKPAAGTSGVQKGKLRIVTRFGNNMTRSVDVPLVGLGLP